MTGIITTETRNWAGAMFRQQLEDESYANATSTSSNMRNYLSGGAPGMPVQESERLVVNSLSSSSSGNFDNRVPLNLLPYKKDQITIEHARRTYRCRHVLNRDDSTIGLAYNDGTNVTEYRAEKELIFDAIIAAGKLAYERRIVSLAAEIQVGTNAKIEK